MNEMERKTEKIKVGSNIIYKPNHANNITHEDCERGYVTSLRDDFAFCRFYYKDGILRTTANSEMVKLKNLVLEHEEE